MGHLNCKDNGFLSCPDLKPSCDKQRSSMLSHGSRDRPRGYPMSHRQVRNPHNQKTQPDPCLLELSRSFALDAVFGFHFPFEKPQGHFTKLGNRIQIRSQFAFFTVNRYVLKLLSRMQSIIPYQILPCLKSTAITFNFVRVCALGSCINS